MASAYILAKVNTGKDKAVFRDIKMIPGVNKLRMTFGPYDLVIEVDFETIEELDEFVFGKLRKIPKIRETLTVIRSKTVT